MKLQKAKYEENAFLSRGGRRDNPGHTGTHDPGTPRDTVTGAAPGHPGTRTRDTPGQLVFMNAAGAEDLRQHRGPKEDKNTKPIGI